MITARDPGEVVTQATLASNAWQPAAAQDGANPAHRFVA
jgi:hypothetical protein